MAENIFLPNNEDFADMVMSAWDDYVERLPEDGVARRFLDEEQNKIVMMSMFLIGYRYGYDDCEKIIRGQSDALEEAMNILRGKARTN